MDTRVAVKKLVKPFQNEGSAQLAFRELRAMQIVDHRNVRIVKLCQASSGLLPHGSNIPW
jgi:hypothetical protein